MKAPVIAVPEFMPYYLVVLRIPDGRRQYVNLAHLPVDLGAARYVAADFGQVLRRIVRHKLHQ